jgi:hypothetical protein
VVGFGKCSTYLGPGTARRSGRISGRRQAPRPRARACRGKLSGVLPEKCQYCMVKQGGAILEMQHVPFAFAAPFETSPVPKQDSPPPGQVKTTSGGTKKPLPPSCTVTTETCFWAVTEVSTAVPEAPPPRLYPRPPLTTVTVVIAPYWSMVQLTTPPVPPPPCNVMDGGVAYPRPPDTIATEETLSPTSVFETNPVTSSIAPDPTLPGLPLGYLR